MKKYRNQRIARFLEGQEERLVQKIHIARTKINTMGIGILNKELKQRGFNLKIHQFSCFLLICEKALI